MNKFCPKPNQYRDMTHQWRLNLYFYTIVIVYDNMKATKTMKATKLLSNCKDSIFNFTKLDGCKHLSCKERPESLNILHLLIIRLRRRSRSFEAALKQNKNYICNASSHLMVYLMQLPISSNYHEVKEKKQSVSTFYNPP